MTEIEKMEKYVERTKMVHNERYSLHCQESFALARHAQGTGDPLYEAIFLAFSYGAAKGYRAAKAEVKG